MPFKSERIKEAILRAAKAAEVDDADYCATVAAVVSEQMQGRNQVDINEIQTAVENQLMSGPYKQLARAYICLLYTSIAGHQLVDRDLQPAIFAFVVNYAQHRRGIADHRFQGICRFSGTCFLNKVQQR